VGMKRFCIERERVGRQLLLGLGLWLASQALGCGGPEASSKPSSPSLKGARITVGIIGDPALLTTVIPQRGEWEASRGAACVVLETPVEPSAPGGAQVLIFRADRLGDLVDAGALSSLPESVVQPPPAPVENERDSDSRESSTVPSEADALQFFDVIPAFRDQVAKYGTDRLALPYGGSALVLVYNRKAFEREENREAAEADGLVLAAPKTWKDLDALARFFSGRDWNGDGVKEHGIALAFGPDPEGVGDATYLAWAASLGQHRDHFSLLFDADTMTPRVTTPPFQEALEGLVALRGTAPPGAEGFDIDKARAAFRSGSVAFLIDRAERAGLWGGSGAKSIGVAALPGSERVYEPSREAWEEAPKLNRPSYLPYGGGWLVGLATSVSGRERDAAIDFIKYLASPETSNRVRADRAFPMLPVRASQVSIGLTDPRSAPGVEPRLWTEAVGATLLALRVVPGLRIPGTDGYLTDLSEGRVAAVKGEPADAALKRIAAAWIARTSALGAERQIWHYRRSLNRLLTAPRPPDRPSGGGQ
jgi:multiple sugar transport system substrate-binding protein